MKNYIQPGKTIDVIAPRNLDSGEGFEVEDLFLIATAAALQGEVVAGARVGVYDLPQTGVTIAQGVKVYWDDSAKECTLDGADTFIGFAVADSADSDATVKVVLMTAIDGGQGAKGDPGADADNRLYTPLDHGEIITTTAIGLFVVPEGKTAQLVAPGSYYNATGLAENDTNFFEVGIRVEDGDTIASWSTEETAGDGSIPAGEAVELQPGDAVATKHPAGTAIEFFADETETATLPAGRLNVIWLIEDAE